MSAAAITPRVKTCESPILSLTTYRFATLRTWANEFQWACDDALGDLFELGEARRIVFVAKSRPDKTTYKVQLSTGGCFVYVQGKEHVLYDALSIWLREQIEQGRPHIGVRIVKENTK